MYSMISIDFVICNFIRSLPGLNGSVQDIRRIKHNDKQIISTEGRI